jgi:ParB-like chromosome segregation protein Spo0J
MKIKVNQLCFNPYRNVDKYPVNKQKVEELKVSMKETTFWDNILARPKPGAESKYEIAYGHHRLIAIRELEIKEVDIPIRDLDDATMLRIMANENMDMWKSVPSVLYETVRAARDFLDKEIKKYWAWEDFCLVKSNQALFDDEHSFNACKGVGVGWSTILKFLGRNFKQWMIKEALAYIADEESGDIDKEAVESLPSISSAQAFRQTVKAYGIQKKDQKKISNKITEKGDKDITKRAVAEAVKDVLDDTGIKILTTKSKSKKEYKPDINKIAEKVYKELIDCVKNMTFIWEHKKSISDFNVDGIEEAIKNLSDIIGGKK